MLSPSAWTMAIFGVITAAAGVVSQLKPELVITQAGAPWITASARPATDLTITYLSASSFAALNMGAYYVLAAMTNWRPFFWASVPGRLLTALTIAYQIRSGEVSEGQMGLVLFEGVGALVTLGALLFEKRTGKVKVH